MSSTFDALPEKDASSDEVKSPNGRPEHLAMNEGVSSTADEGSAESSAPIETIAEPTMTDYPVLVEPPVPIEASSATEPLFAHYEFAHPRPPRRKPDFADFLLFAVLGFGAFLCSGALTMLAIHYHVFGVSTFKQANDEIHYRIGSQAAWYIITLLFCVLFYPLAWKKNFFTGIQWRAGAATARIGRLIGAAGACFVAALVDQFVLPGPDNAPIDQTFRMPGAVWLLFGFGVTLAPLIEEIAFRGLLLPAFCTAWDWTKEQFTHTPPPPPNEDGFPRWSKQAMIFGSLVVSIPFALMHGEQTAWSIGPFLLLVCISLLLCWVRLGLRSLAASVVVHASYNLLLFSMMALFTGGFRHLDKV